MRSLTEDVEGPHCSAVGETNAAIAILLDLLVTDKRNEEARRECNFKSQGEGVCWVGEGRQGLDRGSSLSCSPLWDHVQLKVLLMFTTR